MNKIIFDKVGSRLKEAREIRNITLKNAGLQVGIHKSTVLRWENGDTEKNIRLYKRFNWNSKAC